MTKKKAQELIRLAFKDYRIWDEMDNWLKNKDLTDVARCDEESVFLPTLLEMIIIQRLQKMYPKLKYKIKPGVVNEKGFDFTFVRFKIEVKGSYSQAKEGDWRCWIQGLDNKEISDFIFHSSKVFKREFLIPTKRLMNRKNFNQNELGIAYVFDRVMNLFRNPKTNNIIQEKNSLSLKKFMIQSIIEL